jgi:predicted AlkP superfamily pyrophosphatase or phosphodiesterase
VVPIAKPGPGYVATHGSPWDYDRRVPILFWRKGMTPFEQPGPVETVDIAPPLSAVDRLKVPEGAFDGSCLDLGGPGDTCGADR